MKGSSIQGLDDQLAAIYGDVMCGDLFELQNIAFDLKSSEYAAFPAAF